MSLAETRSTDRWLMIAIYSTAILIPLSTLSLLIPQWPLALFIGPCFRQGGEWWERAVMMLGVLGAIVAVALAILGIARGARARSAGIIALAVGVPLIVPGFAASLAIAFVYFHVPGTICPPLV